MQNGNGPVDDPITWLIASPLLVVLLFSTALATASALVRHAPSIRRTVVTVEATRHKEIDGLRGCLGISVFIHHVVKTWFLAHGVSWQFSPNQFVLHLGQSSVALFFMITAFLFWGRVLSRGRHIDWAEFLISRVYRLYPVYLLMFGLVATIVVLLTWSGPPQPIGSIRKQMLEWLLMLSAPDINGLSSTGLLVAGVTWSLRYEWLFYLSLPFLAFIVGRSRQPAAAIAALAVVGVIIYGATGHNLFDIKIAQSFLGGIVAAHWVRASLLRKLGCTPIAGLAAIASLVAVVVYQPSAFTWEATAGLGLFFVVVASGHSFWGVLRQPGLLWLGDITYGIYLLHGLLLWFLFQWLWPDIARSNSIIFLPAVIATAIILVLMTSVVFLVIERPAMLMAKRHYGWIRESAAALRINWWVRPRLRRP